MGNAIPRNSPYKSVQRLHEGRSTVTDPCSCDHDWQTYGFAYPRSARCGRCGSVRHGITEDEDRQLGRRADTDRMVLARTRFWEES